MPIALQSFRHDLIRLTIDASSPQLRIALAGELDVAAPDLGDWTAHLDLDDKREVVIDLAGLTFVDSAGLRRLLRLRRRFTELGLPVAIVGARPVVHRVFGAAGESQHLRSR